MGCSQSIPDQTKKPLGPIQNGGHQNNIISDQKKEKETGGTGDEGVRSVVEKRRTRDVGPPPDLKIKGNWRDANMTKILSKMNEHTWRDVCRQFMVKKTPQIKPLTKRKGWKTVRLFVSSTFRDMSSERELLIKHVFPKLAAWCEERRLRFFEVDLRWGVPKNSEARVTLNTCLSEIKRCQKYNENAFFLSLLSERYGWVPTSDMVPHDLKQAYKWLPEISVTAWEVMTGAYWDRNPNALFCLRNPGALEEIKNPLLRDQFYEHDPDYKDALKFLKSEVARQFPDQTFLYKCSLEEETSTGVTLGGLEELGEVVLSFFKNAISRQYPPPVAQQPGMRTQDLFTEMGAEQDKFINFTAANVQGRDSEIESVMRYIKSASHQHHPLVVEGQVGVGKSTILASCAQRCLQEPNYTVFSHFVGATSGSSDWFLFLCRLRMSLLPKEKLPETMDEMKQTMGVFMKRAVSLRCSKANSKIVILIDALHLIDSGGILTKYSLVTAHAQDRLRVVISVPSSEMADVRQACPNMTSVQVLPFNYETKKAMVEYQLGQYNKRLDSYQMDGLLKKRDSGLPMYLDIACEELRVFGVFELLDEKITLLPEDMKGLLQTVFERTILENGDDLVVATICLLVTSRDGLTEAELRKLLVMEPLLPHRKAKKKDKQVFKTLPMAQWTPIYIAFRYYLNLSERDELSFSETFSSMVRDLYIPRDTDRLWWHQRLADFFKKTRDSERRANELPYHLYQLGEYQTLRKVLLDKEIFDHMYTDEMKIELLGYWRECGGYELAATEYQQSFTHYIIEENIENLEEIAVIQTKLSWFFIDIGQFRAAQSLLEGLLEALIGEFGVDAHQLMLPLKATVTMFYRKAQTFLYSTDDAFKQCFNRGKQFSDLCAKVFVKHRHDKDLHLGETFAVCGYFLGIKYLQVAREIFEEVGHTRGLVEVLYNLGEKAQFDPDINVPIGYFEQALQIGLSFFGDTHRHVARCYMLYAQFYWNLYLMDDSQVDYIHKAAEFYQNQTTILSALLGDDHPETKAARDKLSAARDKIT